MVKLNFCFVKNTSFWGPCTLKFKKLEEGALFFRRKRTILLIFKKFSIHIKLLYIYMAVFLGSIQQNKLDEFKIEKLR